MSIRGCNSGGDSTRRDERLSARREIIRASFRERDKIRVCERHSARRGENSRRICANSPRVHGLPRGFVTIRFLKIAREIARGGNLPISSAGMRVKKFPGKTRRWSFHWMEFRGRLGNGETLVDISWSVTGQKLEAVQQRPSSSSV